MSTEEVKKLRTLTPLHNLIVVRPVAVEEKSTGGIYLPDMRKKRPQFGEVLCMGPGKDQPDGSLSPMPDIQVGSSVAFEQYGGVAVRWNDEELYLLRPDELMCLKTDD